MPNVGDGSRIYYKLFSAAIFSGKILVMEQVYSRAAGCAAPTALDMEELIRKNHFFSRASGMSFFSFFTVTLSGVCPGSE